MKFQFRADNNDRTSGIVDTFAKQILTEAALFAFQHVGKRFERTLVSPRDNAAATAIIKECVNGFLQHSFFVADDNIWRA